ncbi:MAG: hypothetical protein ACM3XM_19315, partial [Mycobacterium leprae]
LALAMIGLLLAGCTGRSPSDVQEATPVSEAPKAPATAQAPTEPTATVPEPIYSVPAASVLAPADLLKQAEQAGWEMAKLRTALPPVEGRYQDTSVEDPDYIQYAYLGGALRLYVDSGDQRLLGFLVDTRFAPYAEAPSLAAGSQTAVVVVPPYVAVLHSHPATEAVVEQLKSRSWSKAELEQQLGQPSYRFHQHGVGSFMLTYLPEGLQFEGFDTYQLKMEIPYAAALPRTFDLFAKSMARQLADVQKALASGKRSPDGRFRAGKLSMAGYWGDFLLVQEPGKAEQRYQLGYSLGNYEWLDDHTLIFCEMYLFGDDHPLYTINVLTGERKEAVRLTGFRDSFGVSAPGRIWYMTGDGQSHEAMIEP